MKNHFLVLSIIFLLSLFWGCASSDEAWEEEEKSEPVAQETPTIEKQTKVDTFDVEIENNQKVVYEPKPITPVPSTPVIKNNVENFSIQIGAFKTEENALQFAYNAKNLLNEDIFNIFDKNIGLYRIMVGSFNTKETARSYRDQLVKKYPEYQDAWVVDINKEIKR